jgi:hypothetical protein
MLASSQTSHQLPKEVFESLEAIFNGRSQAPAAPSIMQILEVPQPEKETPQPSK